MNIKTWQEREGVPADTQGHTLDHCVTPAMQAEIDELRAENERLNAACDKFSESEMLLQARPTLTGEQIDKLISQNLMARAIEQAVRTGGDK